MLAAEMKRDNRQGSIVTLICDPGERYLDTYYNPEWIAANIGDISQYQNKLKQFETTGELCC